MILSTREAYISCFMSPVGYYKNESGGTGQNIPFLAHESQPADRMYP